MARGRGGATALLAAAALLLLAASARGERQGCDFPVVDGADLGPEQFHELFVSAGVPVIVRNAAQGWPAMREWTWNNLREAFRGIPLRVGPGPYPDESTTIDEYLVRAQAAWDDRSAEVPGVFQYGQVPSSWSLWAHKDECIPHVSFLHPNSRPIHDNVTMACQLLAKIRVPNFIGGNEQYKSPPNMVTHSGFLIGLQDSGIDYHAHQAAINVIFDGAKQWFMKVPHAAIAAMERLPSSVQVPSRSDWFCAQNPEIDICSVHELQREVIKALREEHGQDFKIPVPATPEEREEAHVGAFARWIATQQVTEELEPDSEVLQCVQHAGEIVFVPQHVQHAVRNLNPTVAMQMQWNREMYMDREARWRMFHHLLSDLDPTASDPDLVDIPMPDTFRPQFQPKAATAAAANDEEHDLL